MSGYIGPISGYVVSNKQSIGTAAGVGDTSTATSDYSGNASGTAGNGAAGVTGNSVSGTNGNAGMVIIRTFYDNTPPTTAPSNFATSGATGTSISATWTPAADNGGGSGIAAYQIALGSTVGGTDYLSFAQGSVGNVTSATINSGFLIPASATIYPTIQAIDYNGNVSASVAGSSFVNSSHSTGWTLATTSSGAPTGIVGEDGAAYWTGTNVLVYGGAHTDTTCSNQGGIFNPSTNTWTSMNAGANVPTGCTWSATAWTGSQLFVWGGLNSAGTHVSTGGLYNPVSDSWTAVTATNAPSGTTLYTSKAAMAGSKIVVWGAFVAAPAGSVYDPVANTWTTMSTTNAPTGNYYDSLVSLGPTVFAWGGDATGSDTATGGIYNPLTNTWTATAVSPIAARESQCSAFVNGQVFIYGGNIRGGSTALSDGALYNPATNVWTTISTTGAPTARNLPNCAAAGNNSVVVWSGSGLNSGGIYNVLTNTWTAMSAASSPGANYGGAISTWTGSAMFLWSGSTNSGGTTTSQNGGLYIPY